MNGDGSGCTSDGSDEALPSAPRAHKGQGEQEMQQQQQGSGEEGTLVTDDAEMGGENPQIRSEKAGLNAQPITATAAVNATDGVHAHTNAAGEQQQQRTQEGCVGGAAHQNAGGKQSFRVPPPVFASTQQVCVCVNMCVCV